MKSLASLILLAALASACATQGPAREPATPQRIDLCTDTRLSPLCAPSSSEVPVRVDTNLKAASRTAHLG